MTTTTLSQPKSQRWINILLVVLLVIGPLLAVGGVFIQRRGADEQARIAFSAANNLYATGQYELAQQAYQQMLNQGVESVELLYNLALTQMVPAGWEIRNERMDGGDALGETLPAEPRRPSLWWWTPDGSPDATRREAEYVDIRDDRLMQYFSLRPGDSIRFRTRLNAAYLGRYFLPGTYAEAMYDNSISAGVNGRWVEVAAP